MRFGRCCATRLVNVIRTLSTKSTLANRVPRGRNSMTRFATLISSLLLSAAVLIACGGPNVCAPSAPTTPNGQASITGMPCRHRRQIHPAPNPPTARSSFRTWRTPCQPLSTRSAADHRKQRRPKPHRHRRREPVRHPGIRGRRHAVFHCPNDARHLPISLQVPRRHAWIADRRVGLRKRLRALRETPKPHRARHLCHCPACAPSIKRYARCPRSTVPHRGCGA